MWNVTPKQQEAQKMASSFAPKIKGQGKVDLVTTGKYKNEDTLSSRQSHHFWTKCLPHNATDIWHW